MNDVSKGKVLLLYPNSEGYGGIANGIALLSGCLKEAGFDTQCFDTTFLNSPPLTHFQRQKHGGVMKADHSTFWGEWTPELPERVPELFLQAIEEYKPDLIAVSIVEVCYYYAISLLEVAKEKFDIPIIAGGITPTLSPELVIENDCIDIVCVGEGEDALVELAEHIVEGKDYADIKNLWVKKNVETAAGLVNEIVKNPLRELKNMDEIPDQDWTIFDENQYYKPYCGTFYRTGFFELARGCPYNCSFCCTPFINDLYSEVGNYLRIRNIDVALDEVQRLKEKHGLELIFFIDDNFLGMPKERFEYFCEQYRKRIDLPFYIQTRSETVVAKEKYIEKLVDANIATIAIGVEHGDEDMRRSIMNRKMSNEDLQKAFDIVHKHGIRTTANIIIGMPGEEARMFKQTIDLLRKLKPKSVSINFFQPYRGTKLREVALQDGAIGSDNIISDSNTCLDLKTFSREKIIEYYENFSKYLEGEIEFEGSF